MTDKLRVLVVDDLGLLNFHGNQSGKLVIGGLETLASGPKRVEALYERCEFVLTTRNQAQEILPNGQFSAVLLDESTYELADLEEFLQYGLPIGYCTDSTGLELMTAKDNPFKNQYLPHLGIHLISSRDIYHRDDGAGTFFAANLYHFLMDCIEEYLDE